MNRRDNPSNSPVPRRLTALWNQKWFPVACGVVWLATTGAGLAFFWRYENMPTAPMVAPAQWPAASGVARTPGIATLVMFAHPKCPCTRASVAELEEVMAHYQGRVSAHVVFYKPRGTSDAWAHTDLWTSAAAIPGVNVQGDEDGAEAARFGAGTSGSVVLYDAAGKLRFNGGITAERGHAGDNEGESAITAVLDGGQPRRTTMPVLGCSIFNPGAKCLKGAATCTR